MKSWKTTGLFFLVLGVFGLIFGCSDKGSGKTTEGGDKKATEGGDKLDRFSNTFAIFNNDYQELLELKKDGTFYLDKSKCRRAVKKCAEKVEYAGTKEKILKQGRECESFPEVESEGVSGSWKMEGDVLILKIGSGAAIRIKLETRKTTNGEITIGHSQNIGRARWIRWEEKNWEENLNRLEQN